MLIAARAESEFAAFAQLLIILTEGTGEGGMVSRYVCSKKIPTIIVTYSEHNNTASYDWYFGK